VQLAFNGVLSSARKRLQADADLVALDPCSSSLVAYAGMAMSRASRLSLVKSSTMITETKQIADMLSCLHDGRIVRATAGGDHLRLEVRIRYLAERVDPRYRSFSVHLRDVTELVFSTWPNDPNCAAALITDPEIIFAPCLDILRCSVADGVLLLTCNQSSPEYDYCGGELRARVGWANFIDEGGRAFSCEELEVLSEAYWDEWSKRTG